MLNKYALCFFCIASLISTASFANMYIVPTSNQTSKVKYTVNSQPLKKEYFAKNVNLKLYLKSLYPGYDVAFNNLDKATEVSIDHVRGSTVDILKYLSNQYDLTIKLVNESQLVIVSPRNYEGMIDYNKVGGQYRYDRVTKGYLKDISNSVYDKALFAAQKEIDRVENLPLQKNNVQVMKPRLKEDKKNDKDKSTPAPVEKSGASDDKTDIEKD